MEKKKEAAELKMNKEVQQFPRRQASKPNQCQQDKQEKTLRQDARREVSRKLEILSWRNRSRDSRQTKRS